MGLTQQTVGRCHGFSTSCRAAFLRRQKEKILWKAAGVGIEMAPLQPRLHLLRSACQSWWRKSMATDALVELKPGEIGMVSGIPQEHLRRRVVIYSPARTASQQGSGKVGKWRINFMSTQKWENPLMGWTSTGDPYANVGESALSFDSAEAAKAFAERHGWDYTVRKRHTPLLKPKSYSDNFKWKGLPKTGEK